MHSPYFGRSITLQLFPYFSNTTLILILNLMLNLINKTYHWQHFNAVIFQYRQLIAIAVIFLYRHLQYRYFLQSQ